MHSVVNITSFYYNCFNIQIQMLRKKLQQFDIYNRMRTLKTHKMYQSDGW